MTGGTSTACAVLLGALVAFLIPAVASAVTDAKVECHRSFSESQYPECRVLNDRVAFHWVVHGPPSADAENTVDPDRIAFAIETSVNLTSEWLALGLSDQGGMKGADLHVVQKTDGKWGMIDLYSSDYVAPGWDDEQDLVLLQEPRFDEGNGVWTYVYGRGLITGDHLQDRMIRIGESQNIAWAFGKGASMSYHGQSRGALRLKLYPSLLPEDNIVIPHDPDERTIELVLDAHTVSTNLNSFLCQSFEVPHDRKYHGISEQVILNSSLAHHINVYGCPQPPKKTGLWECNHMTECQEYMFGWSPGLQEVGIPPKYDAGIAFGGNDPTDPTLKRHLLVQIHYNNPKAIAGVVDRSGMRIHYTPNLRKHDVGFLILGNYVSSGGGVKLNVSTEQLAGPNRCPAACTRKIGQELIFPLGIFFHMHRLGKSLITDHFRPSDPTLPPLSSVPAYDFAFSGFSPLTRPGTTLRPNDTLATYCVHHPSVGWDGEAAGEMCQVFIPIIPKPKNVETCMEYEGYGWAACSRVDDIMNAGVPDGPAWFERMAREGHLVRVEDEEGGGRKGDWEGAWKRTDVSTGLPRVDLQAWKASVNAAGSAGGEARGEWSALIGVGVLALAVCAFLWVWRAVSKKKGPAFEKVREEEEEEVAMVDRPSSRKDSFNDSFR
ncbi:hypothetical protein HK101_008527 [Irineochytrium annulatum]|nr:hypothetical protein HK101_008527 [Irineochytrium annulatum]